MYVDENDSWSKKKYVLSIGIEDQEQKLLHIKDCDFSLENSMDAVAGNPLLLIFRFWSDRWTTFMKSTVLLDSRGHSISIQYRLSKNANDILSEGLCEGYEG